MALDAFVWDDYHNVGLILLSGCVKESIWKVFGSLNVLIINV